MSTNPTAELKQIVEDSFHSLAASVVVSIREYPDETIFIATVPPAIFDSAAVLGNRLDDLISSRGLRGFVTVRQAAGQSELVDDAAKVPALQDKRTTSLLSLLTEKARASEMQPSLAYVPDTAANISRAITPRHHLVFGRRGAGKTSLLLETKRIAISEGHTAIWVNIQTYRRESPQRVLLWITTKICEAIKISFRDKSNPPRIALAADRLYDEIQEMIASATLEDVHVIRLVPRIQDLIRRYVETIDRRLYIFLDDFHYLPRSTQPTFLDLLHSCVRDCDAWLKIAAIKHLSKWFEPDPPVGLQTGHDADHIDLDVTLEDPSRAKKFLEEVLKTYARQVQASITKIYLPGALDRLVVASGAVPRDYMVLAASAVTEARARTAAKAVGQTDVTRAAGSASQIKVVELEEDAASSEGTSKQIVKSLNTLRRFLVDEKRCTYFRVDFKDKDREQHAYSILQSLMDGRLVHLINASVSDEHKAGEKSEVYMLDLSQFSGSRTKKFLKMLDFAGGRLALVETGTRAPKKTATTANDVLGILRRGPLLKLSKLIESN